jgi:hypothetical protein
LSRHLRNIHVVRLSALRLSLCWRLATLAFACSAAWAATPPSEYQVKAVFLFNFAHFVSWPVDTFRRPDAPFVIGILGNDPFGSTLDEVVRGETIDHHPFVVKRFQDARDIEDCNILFIGRAEPARVDEALSALKGRSILTVSDADVSEHRGVMIGLFTENNRVRLRIDLAAAKAANLTISSNLLRPAEIIGGNAPPETAQ